MGAIAINLATPTPFNKEESQSKKQKYSEMSHMETDIEKIYYAARKELQYEKESTEYYGLPFMAKIFKPRPRNPFPNFSSSQLCNSLFNTVIHERHPDFKRPYCTAESPVGIRIEANFSIENDGNILSNSIVTRSGWRHDEYYNLGHPGQSKVNYDDRRGIIDDNVAIERFYYANAEFRNSLSDIMNNYDKDPNKYTKKQLTDAVEHANWTREEKYLQYKSIRNAIETSCAALPKISDLRDYMHWQKVERDLCRAAYGIPGAAYPSDIVIPQIVLGDYRNKLDFLGAMDFQISTNCEDYLRSEKFKEDLGIESLGPAISIESHIDLARAEEEKYEKNHLVHPGDRSKNIALRAIDSCLSDGYREKDLLPKLESMGLDCSDIDVKRKEYVHYRWCADRVERYINSKEFLEKWGNTPVWGAAARDVANWVNRPQKEFLKKEFDEFRKEHKGEIELRIQKNEVELDERAVTEEDQLVDEDKSLGVQRIIRDGKCAYSFGGRIFSNMYDGLLPQIKGDDEIIAVSVDPVHPEYKMVFDKYGAEIIDEPVVLAEKQSSNIYLVRNEKGHYNLLCTGSEYAKAKLLTTWQSMDELLHKDNPDKRQESTTQKIEPSHKTGKGR